MSLQLANKVHYAHLMRLDKPIGIYLLLWPTLWALMLGADGLPPLGLTVIFVAGVIIMRSAGCVINDYADRHVDGSVKRTHQRPLVAGHVSEKEALQLFAVLIGVAFLLVIQLSLPTILLSVVALLLAFSYPFMKRYTYLPQVVLGAAYGWSIPMAIMAVSGEVPLWGWLLFFANLFWTVAYDTMYAMVDRDDDLLIGVKSTAVLFGRFDLMIISLLQVVAVGLLAAVFLINDIQWPGYVGLIVGVGLFIHQFTCIRERDRDACFKAFLDNHYVGLVIAIGLLGNYLLVA